VLWYRQPASVWKEALPIGNGRLGGMVFGRIDYERIQLNEESVWTGSCTVTDKPEVYKFLPEVRRLLFEGKYAEAQEISEREMMVKGTWNMYQTLGDLYFKTNHGGTISEYRRELNLDDAIARVSYRVGDVDYQREYFSSPVDQGMVILFTCSKRGALSLSARLARAKDAALAASKNAIIMKGRVTAGGVDIKDLNPGVQYEARLMAVNDGGRVSVSGDSLVVEKANAVTFYLAAATNYWGSDPHETCGRTLQSISKKKFDKIRKDHIAEH
jgi:alpha-L-fucosidase 2